MFLSLSVRNSTYLICLTFIIPQFISQMADFQLDIKEIQSQDAALTIAEIFVDAAIDEKGLKKDFVQAFFSNALQNLENQAVSPKTKFYTLFVIKELSIKDKITLKIFGPFAQHPLYAYLQELAFTVDPKKPVSEKGKNLFPTDKQTGNNFMRLLLESLISWGTRFLTNSKKEPTRFRRTYMKLTEDKVVLPKEFIYYTNSKKSERSQTPQGPKQPSSDPVSNKGVSNDSISNPASTTPNVPVASKPKQSKEKHLSQIRFMQNKIQSLIQVLEDAETIQELQREIQSYHLKFEKDLKKLQEIQTDVLETTDENLMQLYFHVVQFFHEEARLFKENVSKNQYDVYSTGCHIAFQRIFQEKKQPSKIEPSIDKKLNQSKTEKSKPGLPPPKPSIEKIKTEKSQNVEKENIKKKPSEKQAKDSRAPQRESKLNNKNTAVQSYFSKLQAKSRQQPHQGFGAIAKSLSKEKKVTVASRMKTSNVATNLNKSKFTGGSNFSKSVVKGIFAAPPNPTIRPKSYEGELVVQNMELQRQFEQIRKEQGVRRVKASLFKNKYILYEDDNIQVGFKSSPIYEKVDKFTTMLDFQLFFGNKTAKTINDFQVNFKSDKQSLIYTSPQVVENRIYPQSQIKLQLLNIPKAYPFGLIVLNASYEYSDETRYFTALLPNSILQLSTYFKLDQDSLKRIWSECPKILKTDQFKLSHHFPPDQITHFLPMLKETTPYSKFSEEGSTVDYQLYCQLVIRESLEGVLKIVIRPDLSAIIQVGIYSADEESEKSFKFYLQTLQAVLRELQA